MPIKTVKNKRFRQMRERYIAESTKRRDFSLVKKRTIKKYCTFTAGFFARDATKKTGADMNNSPIQRALAC